MILLAVALAEPLATGQLRPNALARWFCERRRLLLYGVLALLAGALLQIILSSLYRSMLESGLGCVSTITGRWLGRPAPGCFARAASQFALAGLCLHPEGPTGASVDIHQPMRLKHLELQGYKTFAARTDFCLQGGLTAIIGPNGSGKSNVADAIQWVLGEQSFGRLRAKRSEDMIFTGSNERAWHGMAQPA